MNEVFNNERECGKWKETRALSEAVERDFFKTWNTELGLWSLVSVQHCFNKWTMRIGSRLKKRDQKLGWHHLVEVLKCYGNGFRYYQISQILSWSTSHVSNLWSRKYPKRNKLGGPPRDSVALPLIDSHWEDSHMLQFTCIPIIGQFYLPLTTLSGREWLNGFLLLFYYYVLLLTMYLKLSGLKWHPFIISEFSWVSSHPVGSNLLQQPAVGKKHRNHRLKIRLTTLRGRKLQKELGCHC